MPEHSVLLVGLFHPIGPGKTISSGTGCPPMLAWAVNPTPKDAHMERLKIRMNMKGAVVAAAHCVNPFHPRGQVAFRAFNASRHGILSLGKLNRGLYRSKGTLALSASNIIGSQLFRPLLAKLRTDGPPWPSDEEYFRITFENKYEYPKSAVQSPAFEAVSRPSPHMSRVLFGQSSKPLSNWPQTVLCD